jgi:hypothetical protein
MKAIALDRVLELRREAARLCARTAMRHMSALNWLAEREGFADWTTLVAAAGGRDAVAAALGRRVRRRAGCSQG